MKPIAIEVNGRIETLTPDQVREQFAGMIAQGIVRPYSPVVRMGVRRWDVSRFRVEVGTAGELAARHRAVQRLCMERLRAERAGQEWAGQPRERNRV